MKSLYRYQKEHYKKITVKREIYDLLKKLASEKGKSIPDLIKDLIDTYIGGNIGTNTERPRSIGGNIDTYIGGNIASSVADSQRVQSNTMPNTTRHDEEPQVREGC